MEDLETSSDETSATEGGSKLGLAFGLVGVVGILLGAVGIVMANSSRKAVEDLRNEINSKGSQSAQLEIQLRQLEDRFGGVNERIEQQNQNMNKLANALNAINNDNRANRELIAQLSGRFEETVAQHAAPPSKPGTAKDDTGGSGGPATDKPAGGIHKIKSGDTFGKLAAQYGVSLDAIVAANPNVDPRKLQIGQEIKIP